MKRLYSSDPLSGRKGGETDSDDGMEPEGDLLEVSESRVDVKPEAPKDEMEAVFELGATQEAVLVLRRENGELRSEVSQLRTVVEDLAQTVSRTRAELSQEISENRQAEESLQQHHHAKWWERLMAGTP